MNKLQALHKEIDSLDKEIEKAMAKAKKDTAIAEALLEKRRELQKKLTEAYDEHTRAN